MLYLHRGSHLHFPVKSCKGKYFAQEESERQPFTTSRKKNPFQQFKLWPGRVSSPGSRSPPAKPYLSDGRSFPTSVVCRNWRAEIQISSIENRNVPRSKVEKNLRRHNLNLFLVLGVAAVGLGSIHLRTVKAAAADPQTAQLIPAKVTTSSPSLPLPKLPAPGTTYYETRRGDTVISVARHYLGQTSYLTSSELAEAIRGANTDVHSAFLKTGQQLTIPGILDNPITEKSIPVTKDFEVRAVYLTGLMAGSDRGIKIVK